MVKNSKTPIAVIGVGFLGEFHIQQILRINDFQLIGIYDIDEKRLEAMGSKYGVHTFSSIDDTLSDNPAERLTKSSGPSKSKFLYTALRWANGGD